MDQVGCEYCNTFKERAAVRWRRFVVRAISEASSFSRVFSKPRKGFRVLMYHSIGTHPGGAREGIFSIIPERFEQHMASLAQYREASIVKFSNGLKHEGALKIAVTFDDGYKDNLYVSAPILLKYKIPFTVFVTTSFVEWSKENYLTPAELRELSELPNATIGSHGMTHISLTECDDRQLKNELILSKKYLEDLIGKPVNMISYPFGAVDRRVRDTAEKAGYLLAACSRFDINDISRDPFLLCRTEITGNDSVRVFQQKLHGDWDWYRWKRKDPASS
jgi:peptidoglycan/xylan/chitin deacetylase (PgdA/CDA1 family)